MGANGVKLFRLAEGGASQDALRFTERIFGKRVSKLRIPKLSKNHSSTSEIAQGLEKRIGATEEELKAYSEACTVIEKFRINKAAKEADMAKVTEHIPQPVKPRNLSEEVLSLPETEADALSREYEAGSAKAEKYLHGSEEIHAERQTLEHGAKPENIRAKNTENFAAVEDVSKRDLPKETGNLKRPENHKPEVKTPKTATYEEEIIKSEEKSLKSVDKEIPEIKIEKPEIKKEATSSPVKEEENALLKNNKVESKVEEGTKNSSKNSDVPEKSKISNKVEKNPKTTSKSSPAKESKVENTTKETKTSKKVEKTEIKKEATSSPVKKEETALSKNNKVESKVEEGTKNSSKISDVPEKAKISNKVEKNAKTTSKSSPAKESKVENITNKTKTSKKVENKTEKSSLTKDKTTLNKTEEKNAKTVSQSPVAKNKAKSAQNIYEKAGDKSFNYSETKDLQGKLNIFSVNKTPEVGIKFVKNPVQIIRQTAVNLGVSINNFAQKTQNVITQSQNKVKDVCDKAVSKAVKIAEKFLPEKFAVKETVTAKTELQNVKSQIIDKVKTDGEKVITSEGKIPPVKDVAKNNIEKDLKTNEIAVVKSSSAKTNDVAQNSFVEKSKQMPEKKNKIEQETATPAVSTNKQPAVKSEKTKSEVSKAVEPQEPQNTANSTKTSDKKDLSVEAQKPAKAGDESVSKLEPAEVKNNPGIELKQTDMNLKNINTYTEQSAEKSSVSDNAVFEAFSPEKTKKEIFPENIDTKSKVTVSNEPAPENPGIKEQNTKTVVSAEKSPSESTGVSVNANAAEIKKPEVLPKIGLSKQTQSVELHSETVTNRVNTDVSHSTVQDTFIKPEEFEIATGTPTEISEQKVKTILEPGVTENSGLSQNIRKNFVKSESVQNDEISKSTAETIELSVQAFNTNKAPVNAEKTVSGDVIDITVAPREVENIKGNSMKKANEPSKNNSLPENKTQENTVIYHETETPVHTLADNPLKKQPKGVKTSERVLLDKKYSFIEKEGDIAGSIKNEENINFVENPVRRIKSGRLKENSDKDVAEITAETFERFKRENGLNAQNRSLNPSKQEDFIAVSNSVPVKGESTESEILEIAESDAIKNIENNGKGSGGSSGRNGGQSGGQKSGQGSGKNRG